ncbi:MarR family winged helix-turn-helix transcriptional regulator [Archangium primigenium]|uniref:MarR family winged helix-turn-helix transcriptional regulator n=1 Tax=[Archangium] primigenium TaxID=2792470 RepID=UPI001958F98A|nr:MarR family transcriptional regulator [Archangium primigenium]MBM7114457.1 MarR family transcriptional regulator [Archangium primigenium]
MSKIDPAKIWSLKYRLLMSVISHVTPDIVALGVETKELFVLAALEEHPYPAELAATLSMPKPTVTVYVKRLEAAGFVSREIDTEDMRRHRLRLTPAGRKVMNQGLTLLSGAFGERLGRLSAAQQEELRMLLEKMS